MTKLLSQRPPQDSPAPKNVMMDVASMARRWRIPWFAGIWISGSHKSWLVRGSVNIFLRDIPLRVVTLPVVLAKSPANRVPVSSPCLSLRAVPGPQLHLSRLRFDSTLPHQTLVDW